jgi:hypothetical protein
MSDDQLSLDEIKKNWQICYIKPIRLPEKQIKCF